MCILLSRQLRGVNIPSIDGSCCDRQAITFNPMRNKLNFSTLLLCILNAKWGSAQLVKELKKETGNYFTQNDAPPG
jgi:peroxiredoxin